MLYPCTCTPVFASLCILLLMFCLPFYRILYQNCFPNRGRRSILFLKNRWSTFRVILFTIEKFIALDVSKERSRVYHCSCVQSYLNSNTSLEVHHSSIQFKILIISLTYRALRFVKFGFLKSKIQNFPVILNLDFGLMSRCIRFFQGKKKNLLSVFFFTPSEISTLSYTLYDSEMMILVWRCKNRKSK